MKKMKVIALVAALVLAFCVYKYLGVLNTPKEEPRMNVVVCAVDIPENTTITADMIKVEAVLAESVLPNAVTNPDEVIGLVMNSNMYAGEQVLPSRLVQLGAADAASDSLAYVVEPGMRGVTVAVSMTTGLGNMLRPGNSVDVVMQYNAPDEENPESEGIPTASYLMQDIQVLAVDTVLNKGAVDVDGYATVTLSVTPEQALDLSFVEQNCSLRLVMRSSVDDEIVTVADVDMESLVG